MSVAPEPVEAAAQTAGPEISEAAQHARDRLHEEIERVRSGVEEMLDTRQSVPAPPANGGAQANPFVVAVDNEEIRRELEEMRLETRTYVKRKVRKSEKKLERSVRELEARSDALEQRIDQVEADREEAEWRLHNNTEEMLDGLLEDVRSIADQLAEPPAAAPPSPPAVPAPPAKLTPPAAAAPAAAPLRVEQPVGRIGRPKR